MVSRITFIAWKDIRHPAAGGAELWHHEVSRRWVAQGHRVLHLVPGFPGAPAGETVDGVDIVRVGRGILAFPRLAGVYRRRFLAGTDVLIDVFNCVGSLACLRPGPRTRTLLVHHVQGRMWGVQTVFPGVPRPAMLPIAAAGAVVEAVHLARLARADDVPVLAASASTREALRRRGFPARRIHVFREAVAIPPLAGIAQSAPKADRFTVLMIGPRRSKRPRLTLDAFARLQARHPDTALQVAGWGTEDARIARRAARLGLRHVEILGRVDEARKRDLLQRAHVLCTTPLKEGWGLVVTEANAMGTPVVAADVPGLRDAMASGVGRLCRATPDALAEGLGAIRDLWAEDRAAYDALRRRAIESARPFTFEAAAGDVALALNL
jgi:glycosyltransferase involved in cell wall biosynthesis